MNLDPYGLPCQSNGDCEDQLNRVGLISLACFLNYHHAKADVTELEARCDDAISDPMGLLVYGPGTYTRHTKSGPGDVTCDQLIPVLAYHVAIGDGLNVKLMFEAMVKRYGFAQNVHADNDPTTKTTPDLMFFRALPLFARYSKWLYPVAVIADLYVVIMIISLIISDYNAPNSVDDNNTLATVLTCITTHPTFVARFAAWLYAKCRPTNYGVTQLGETNNIQGAMSYYHRAAAGGNPEIAEMYRTLIKEFLA